MPGVSADEGERVCEATARRVVPLQSAVQVPRPRTREGTQPCQRRHRLSAGKGLYMSMLIHDLVPDE